MSEPTASLDRIRALHAGITPGPWFRDSSQDQDGSNFTENVTARLWDVALCPGGDTAPEDGRKEQASRDAAFIAAAPSIVAQLLAVVGALEEYAAIAESLCEMNGTDVRLASVPVVQIRAAITREGGQKDQKEMSTGARIRQLLDETRTDK